MPKPTRLIAALALAFSVGAGAAAAQEPAVREARALAEFGDPLYGEDFDHFAYVDPDAPKGGEVTLAAFGSFDSLNSIILRGQYPLSLGLASDSLMVGSGDELGAAYPLIAERVEYPEDLSWAVFHLRPEARFHDGHPVTAEDFVFAWDAIQEHGRPFLQSFLEDVEGVEALSDHELKVTFRTRDQMRPLLNVATVLSPQPVHWWTAEGRDISRTTLEPPLTSGPYRVAKVDAGRSISYERVPDYWGKDLPVNVGQNNFDRITYDYYRDDDVMFEAFKGGAYDFRQENRAQRWTTGYDFPAAANGQVQRRALPDERPVGAQGFRFNTRRDKFADPRVREALGHLFDFEWIQKNLLYGQYERVKSNFPNSDWGASGPPTPEELAILEPYRDRLPEEVLTEAYEPPRTDGSGNIRANLRKAQELFREAGWELRGGKLTNVETGERMTIEFLEQGQTMVRLIQPYADVLKRAGIDTTIRVVDSAQYQNRTDEFDFDAVSVFFNFFPPPGPEMRSYFGSEAADVKGSANYAGIREPVADELIEKVIASKDLEEKKALNRALDRVLLWGHYMVPQWYNDETWIAHWDKFGWPEQKPKYATGFPGTWWHDETKAERLAAR